MARFTFLEVHFDGAEFTANAPFSSAQTPEDAPGLGGLPLGAEGDESAESQDAGEESGGLGAVPVVLSVLGLALVLVLVLRRILGGSGEPVLDE